MLVEAKFCPDVLPFNHRCAPKASHEVQLVEERLVFRQSEDKLCLKEIVRSIVLILIHGVTVFH